MGVDIYKDRFGYASLLDKDVFCTNWLIFWDRVLRDIG